MKRHSAIAVSTLTIIAALPGLAQARGSNAPLGSMARTMHHHLPKGNSSTSVFSFGVQGGSLRPWNVTLSLDGSINANGVTATVQKLTDPVNTLKGLLALADAEGFFAMSKQIGCSGGGSPDISAQTISVATSTGSKKVSVFGACKAPFNQLYAVLQQIAGTTR